MSTRLVPFSALRGPPHWPVMGALPFFSTHGGPTGMNAVCRALYRYGNAVSLTLFGDTTLYVFDPHEFLKVHRAAGKTPSGGTTDLWMFTDYYNTPRVRARWGAMPMAFSEGEAWRAPRHALQKDLFGADDVLAYMPAINEVVEEAVAKLPDRAASGAELQHYTCRVTFELIAAVLLGKRMGVLERAAPDPLDDAFVEATLETQRAGAALLYSPLGTLSRRLNTRDYGHFCAAMDCVLERAATHVEAFADARGEGGSGATAGRYVGGVEPYLAKLLDGASLSRADVVINVGGLLQGGVDTTANSLAWLLVHLASHPEEQALVADEVRAVLGGGTFDAAALPRLPRLRAAVRESHRLTPTVMGTVRTLPTDFEIADSRRGVRALVPAGTRIAFASIGWSTDAALIDAPERFSTARWLGPKEARKGGALEALDHPLLAQPFSFGPRMCLGARLAQLELYAMLARTLAAWELRLDPVGQAWSVRNDFLSKPDPFPKLSFAARS
jgi:cytochrome P450